MELNLTPEFWDAITKVIKAEVTNTVHDALTKQTIVKPPAFPEYKTTRELQERSSDQDDCYAGVGAVKFTIHFKPLNIHTSIGADNVHHAMNKATKLWKDGWTNLDRMVGRRSSDFVPVREYGKLVKEYQRLKNAP